MKKTAIILMCVMLSGVLFGCSGNTVPMSGGGTQSNLFDRRMPETEDSQGGSGAIPKNGANCLNVGILGKAKANFLRKIAK